MNRNILKICWVQNLYVNFIFPQIFYFITSIFFSSLIKLVKRNYLDIYNTNKFLYLLCNYIRIFKYFQRKEITVDFILLHVRHVQYTEFS